MNLGIAKPITERYTRQRHARADNWNGRTKHISSNLRSTQSYYTVTSRTSERHFLNREREREREKKKERLSFTVMRV